MRLFVPLTRDEFDRLRALAISERRRPQEQAAILLAGLLKPGPLDVATLVPELVRDEVSNPTSRSLVEVG